MYSVRRASSIQKGLTLIELIVGIAILGIMAAIAIPSFTETIQSNRQAANVNSFLASLKFARSEAIKRSATITVCKSSNQSSCNIQGNIWENGWIVFFDRNGDGIRTVTSTPDTNETLLRANASLNSGLTLRPTATFNNNITYTSKGINQDITAGLFSFCDGRGASEARAVSISATGSTTSTKTQLDGSALTCP